MVIRFKGFQTGSQVELSDVTVAEQSTSLPALTFQKPAKVSGLPRVSDGTDMDTFTVDTTGLTGITGYEWREYGEVAVLGTSSTLSGMGQENKQIVCEVTCDQGVLVSPPVLVYGMLMMAAGLEMAPMMADDRAILDLVPHKDVTHIAVADGSWLEPTTWLGGTVPRYGAFVLIPHGRSVTYDVSEQNVRLDRVRVDGTLTWALDRSTQMFVETVIITRGGWHIQGTSSGRLPAQYTAEMVFSGKDYGADSYIPTELSFSRSATLDPKLWARGFICQGGWRFWGNEKRTWDYADAGVPAGATSLTMQRPPVGVIVGDEICIGGTAIGYTPAGPLAKQDEYRTLTGVSGNTLFWDTPLVHSHENQLAGSTRTDLYPVVMLRGGKNIIYRSEVTTPEYMRGHTAAVHGATTVDNWDAQFIDLGRTSKAVASGVVNGDGDFRFYNGSDTVAEALTARSNLQSRYPWHGHHLGFGHMGARPVVANCYVEGATGHAMVHHASDMDMIDNAMHLFYGCGMVSESGNELGAWVGNLALGASGSEYAELPDYSGNQFINPKTLTGESGTRGDNFKYGYGFGMRGRGMRQNRNVACSVTWGFVFFHRDSNPNDAVAVPIELPRAYLDLKETSFALDRVANADLFKFTDYPIVHFADNEAIATLVGAFVSKEAQPAFHDVNSKWKRFKTWGFASRGAEIEYVGTYILDQFDSVASSSSGTCIQFGNNGYQLGIINTRMEGGSRGLRIQGGDSGKQHDNYSLDDPRWFNIAPDFVDHDDENEDYPSTDDPINRPTDPAVKTLSEVRYYNDDFDGTLIDYDLNPSETYPTEVGSWDGDSNLWSGSRTFIDNTTGNKIDNISSVGKLAPKPLSTEEIFPVERRDMVFLFKLGYYTYQGNPVAAFSNIISDRVTGRPFKYMKLVGCDVQTPPTGDLIGPFTIAATPCVQSDKLATVAENGSVVVDVVTGTTGAGGSGTYTLDLGDYISPDHGKAELDETTGEVTYTPDRGYVGTDEMYVFVKSENRYATVRIDILIGAGGAVSTPTTPTVTDHADANTIGVQLLTPPSAGGRRINFVQYSTDGGVTWRRLCHNWVQAVHKVTVESDGTAISAGSYNVRIRYKTNYDYTVSAATADVAVAVS